MKEAVPTVLVFGIYERDYPHNRMLIRGLEENGYNVAECHVDPKKFPGLKKYLELARIARVVRKEHTYSFVLVLSPGHTVVWLARWLFPRVKILFDAFVSLYDSNVHDRKIYSRLSLYAIRDWLLDWSSTKLAWRVILDTNAHIEYFVQTFGTAREKCIRVFVGTDQTLFSISAEVSIPPEPFIVHFHGTYIPLQGIPHIIDAARILQDEGVVFRIVGSSNSSAYARTLRESAKDLVEKGIVKFIDAVPFAELAPLMAESHVCLGIFGDTEKAQRVIPNKVYEILALPPPHSRPIVTADTPAIRELLSEKTAVLVSAKSEKMSAALAEALRALKSNPQKCQELATAAAELFETRLQRKQLVAEMLENLSLEAV